MSVVRLLKKNGGDVVTVDDLNALIAFLSGDIVPIAADGNPTALAGSLGSEDFPWYRLHVQEIHGNIINRTGPFLPEIPSAGQIFFLTANFQGNTPGIFGCIVDGNWTKFADASVSIPAGAALPGNPGRGEMFILAEVGKAPALYISLAAGDWVKFDLTGGGGGSNLPARLEIFPPNVRDAAGIRRNYTARLSEAQQSLLFDKHTDAPIDRIRLTERETGAVLHEEPWAYSLDDWVIQFAISAAEARNIGLSGSAEEFEIRAEFGRGIGNAFQTLEATNWFMVLVGHRPEYPASIGTSLAGDTIIRYEVSTADEMALNLAAHLREAPDGASLYQVNANFKTDTRDYTKGQKWYLSPNVASEALMVLISDHPDASVAAGVPPFGDIGLYPAGIPGQRFPERLYFFFHEKATAKEIKAVTLTIAGFYTYTPHATTPIRDYNTALDGLIRFDLPLDDRVTIDNNLDAADIAENLDILFTFTDETTHTIRFKYPVNNPAFTAAGGGLTQTQVDARVRAVAGPVIIISNIASYDAAQNRFEDSGGNAVVVPDGAIVTLTQAVYDIAAADSGFTPNANAIFLTR